MSHFLNTDCMEVLRDCEDNYFDLAIVDPPYFSGPERREYYGKKVSTTGVFRSYRKASKWEVPGKEYFDELMRVSKNQIIWGGAVFRLSIYSRPDRLGQMYKRQHKFFGL